jgi:glyoxalase family protein
MKLEGLHHITAITGDAPRNVEFYAGTLGLRMVKKTVNQDDPTVYHLFYGDEHGSPGADLTFFEYPGAVGGRAGAGMVHRVVWRVASPEAIEFWEQRLGDEGTATERTPDGGLRFSDPEGLDHELVVGLHGDEGLMAEHPDIPAEMALQGFDGVRAYSAHPDRSAPLLEDAMGFRREGGAWELRGDLRGSTYVYDEPPAESPIPGAGTIHHVAWASRIDELGDWRTRVQQGGARPTDQIDRFYFRSIYFREPSGVLFEIATMGPGFATDEDQDHLGERLSLPPAFEHLRDRLEPVLTPLPNPRAAERSG